MKKFSKYTFFSLAAGTVIFLLCSQLFLHPSPSAFSFHLFSTENNTAEQKQPDRTNTSNLTNTSPSETYTPLEGMRVVLDPGHGGNDAGAIWDNLYEKDLTLQITKNLEQLLIDHGCTVFTTREDDTYISLKDRVQIAESKDADLFISLHLNAFEEDPSVSGIETYATEASNPNSSLLANAIHTGLLEETGARDRDVKTDSNFYVLRHTTIPSCLVEVGFLTSETERPLLQNASYQEKIISGILQGILQYWEEIR